MLRGLIVRCSLLVILLSASTVWGESTIPYQRIDRNVVCIQSVMANGSTLMGTGFFISNEVLATVSHQVQGSKKVTLHLKDGHIAPGHVLAQHKGWDVALLKAPTTQMTGLPLATEETLLGQDVFTIGCPLGLDHSLSRGVVSNPKRMLDGKLLLQTDLTVNNGNSGGPLLNNEGNVVGVIMGSWSEGTGVNFAVPVSRLLALIQAAKIELSPLPNLLQHIETEKNLEVRLIKYRQLAADYPEEIDVYLRLGITYQQLGQQEEARNALIQAIAIDPDAPLIYWNLGMVYAVGLHNVTSARQAFLKYLQLQPNGDKAPQVRAWLAAAK